MATAAQLHAEVWWGREITTEELDWLADNLCERTGRPRTAAGTKGNEVHLRGGHRSQEWILKSAFCTNRTYTVQSGLTETQARHVAALDFTPGSPELMIAQCKRLMAAMKAGLLDEVVELYGNVDGDQVVDGWDNLHDRAATSDSSHLWHWHLTFDRRHLTNRALMERILAIVMGDDDMQTTDQMVVPPWMKEKWADDKGLQDGKIAVSTTLVSGYGHSRAGREAAERAVAKLDALAAAFTALAAGGTSVDTAAVLAAVNKVGDDLGAQLAAMTAERDELAVRLAAALNPAA